MLSIEPPYRPLLRATVAIIALTTSLLPIGAAHAAELPAVHPTSATDAASGSVETEEPQLVNEKLKRPKGVARLGRVLKARKGRWNKRPDKVRYHWLRDGKEIKNAKKRRRYRVQWRDVGHRIQVRVVAKRDGYRKGEAVSGKRKARHRLPVRRTMTYSVQTRGKIRTSVKKFKKQAKRTFEDPRGWRGAGIRFRRVGSGGDFTLVLSQAAKVPSFSSQCSAQWSCRVGRWVIINDDRWRFTTASWRNAHKNRRSYRHMVVNHEVGHRLGLGHRSCPRRGALAPVMQQQSKGTQGCRLNPWPTLSELRAVS